MAQTLTEERRLAWRAKGTGPDPAYTLIIFKKKGTERVLHQILKPGQALRLGRSDSPDKYLAYAIPTEEVFKHSFSRMYQSISQTRKFTLHFSLELQVDRAEVLARNLGDDPLKRLEEETAKVLGAVARRLPWEVLQLESPEFDSHLLRADSMEEGLQERRSNLERLQSFASSFGLDLRHVEITRSLQNADRRADVEARKVKTLKGAEAAQLVLELERDRLQVSEGAERLRMVLDRVTKEGLQGFSPAVDGIRSFPAIQDAIAEIRSIKSSLMSFAARPPSMPESGAPDRSFLANPRRGSSPPGIRRPDFRRTVEHETATWEISRVAEYLQDHLGQKITAYLGGLDNAKTVGLWISGESEPRDPAKTRLRYAYHAARLLIEAYDDETAKAWFFGCNALLDDEAPAYVLRHGSAPGDFRLIVPAVRRLLESTASVLVEAP